MALVQALATVTKKQNARGVALLSGEQGITYIVGVELIVLSLLLDCVCAMRYQPYGYAVRNPSLSARSRSKKV